MTFLISVYLSFMQWTHKIMFLFVIKKMVIKFAWWYCKKQAKKTYMYVVQLHSTLLF